jgi:enoyl-[acyl-carrier-protein] reductase (NADH)
MIPEVEAKLLECKRGLLVGIANENSIAWGCAKAFRAFGAELAVTYLNDKAKKTRRTARPRVGGSHHDAARRPRLGSDGSRL